MRILKKILAFSLCGFALYQFCSHATDGFSIRKIQTNLETHSDWETPNGYFALDQPFSYLGHGAQVYAFVSFDGKYVLKFYRHNRASHPFAFLAPLLPPPLKKRLLSTIEKRKNKRLKDFSSYLLAYHHLAKESGLLDLHLNPTEEQRKVKIYDKIGVEHILDVSHMQYLLQKRAKPIYALLEEWISQGEMEYAKEQLSKLVTLLRTRCQKGIFDKDPDLKTNFGFTDDGPIQFDIGRFKLDPTRTDPNIYRDDLIRITDRLCQWLEERAPALAAHIEQEIAK